MSFSRQESGGQYRMPVGKGAMFKTSWKMTQTEVMMRSNGSVQSEGPEHNCWQPAKDF